MFKIAKQMKGFVSKVGIVQPIGENAFKLKFISSEKEVEFCGHAIIAIMNDLIKNNPELLDSKQVEIYTNMRKSIVENRIRA
jgi:predicted PhzF superfamily epimerase YddE/YHI9